MAMGALYTYRQQRLQWTGTETWHTHTHSHTRTLTVYWLTKPDRSHWNVSASGHLATLSGYCNACRLWLLTTDKGACRATTASYIGQYIISEQSVTGHPFVVWQNSSGAQIMMFSHVPWRSASQAAGPSQPLVLCMSALTWMVDSKGSTDMNGAIVVVFFEHSSLFILKSGQDLKEWNSWGTLGLVAGLFHAPLLDTAWIYQVSLVWFIWCSRGLLRSIVK